MMIDITEGAFARRLLASAAILALGAATITITPAPVLAQEELNALVWCDHTDPALIEPFEQANNVNSVLNGISQSWPMRYAVSEAK